MRVSKYFNIIHFAWICITLVCSFAACTGHTPGTWCSPSAVLAEAGSSWRSASGAEGAQDNDGSVNDRGAEDIVHSLEKRKRCREEDWCVRSACTSGVVQAGTHLEACRCRTTAAAPSRLPSVWSTRSRGPRSPAGHGPPDLRGASARRPWSPHRTALTDRQTWGQYCSTAWQSFNKKLMNVGQIKLILMQQSNKLNKYENSDFKKDTPIYLFIPNLFTFSFVIGWCWHALFILIYSGWKGNKDWAEGCECWWSHSQRSLLI